MFRLISIVLAVVLAGMGEASLMMQENSAEDWAEVGIETQNNASNTVDVSEEVDFNAHFMQSIAPSGTDTINEESDAVEGDVMIVEDSEIPRVNFDSGLEHSELIHLMINGQVDHTVQMHN